MLKLGKVTNSPEFLANFEATSVPCWPCLPYKKRNLRKAAYCQVAQLQIRPGGNDGVDLVLVYFQILTSALRLRSTDTFPSTFHCTN